MYAALVMANGAVMEGIEAKLFFTFFGLEANHHIWSICIQPWWGNPMRACPATFLFLPSGIVPGMEAMASSMMRKNEELDVPHVGIHGDDRSRGGEIFACKLAVDIMFGLKKEDLSEHVKDIITIAEFYELAVATILRSSCITLLVVNASECPGQKATFVRVFVSRVVVLSI